jgi:predicted Zn-dependent protease with MMP-like domain
VTVAGAIAATLDGLPAWVRSHLARVSIRTKDRPDDSDLRRGSSGDQFGYFWGSGPERDACGTELPDRRPPEGDIVLFLDNLAPLTFPRFRLALLHEIAHVLGYPEEEIVNHLGLRL